MLENERDKLMNESGKIFRPMMAKKTVDLLQWIVLLLVAIALLLIIASLFYDEPFLYYLMSGCMFIAVPVQIFVRFLKWNNPK